jgi:hypothetical protein
MLYSRRISRYLVIIFDGCLLYVYLYQEIHEKQYMGKRSIKPPKQVALSERNCGSRATEGWLSNSGQLAQNGPEYSQLFNSTSSSLHSCIFYKNTDLYPNIFIKIKKRKPVFEPPLYRLLIFLKIEIILLYSYQIQSIHNLFRLPTW